MLVFARLDSGIGRGDRGDENEGRGAGVTGAMNLSRSGDGNIAGLNLTALAAAHQVIGLARQHHPGVLAFGMAMRVQAPCPGSTYQPVTMACSDWLMT